MQATSVNCSGSVLDVDHLAGGTGNKAVNSQLLLTNSQFAGRCSEENDSRERRAAADGAANTGLANKLGACGRTRKPQPIV